VRAAIWAAAIAGAGYMTLVTRHLFWLPDGTLHLLPMMFDYLATLLLAPGLMIIALLRTVAFVVMHSGAAYHFVRAIQPGEGIAYAVDMHPAHATVLSSAVLTWIFYFVILSRTSRTAGQSVPTNNSIGSQKPSASSEEKT
jgi:hypothetical protein